MPGRSRMVQGRHSRSRSRLLALILLAAGLVLAYWSTVEHTPAALLAAADRGAIGSTAGEVQAEQLVSLNVEGGIFASSPRLWAWLATALIVGLAATLWVAGKGLRAACPNASFGFATDVALLVCCVLGEVAVYLIGERASTNYVKQSVLLCSSSASAVLAAAISASRDRDTFHRCFEPARVLTLMPVSVGFSFSMLALLLSFQYFDGAYIKLIGQMKLPLTALLSTLVLKHRYSALQWQHIFLIVVTCSSFSVLRFDSDAPSASNLEESSAAVGMMYIAVWILFNCSASLIAEHALKTHNLPFEVVICNMRLGESAVTLAVLLWRGEAHPAVLFAGWNWSTVAVMLSLFADAWLSALVVKRLSTVHKNASKCASLVLLYLFSVLSGRQPAVLAQALAALLVVQATLLFAAGSQPARSGSE